MKTKNTKIQDYKTFEEIKTKSFKNLYNWSAQTPEHHGVEIEASNIIVKKFDGKTPLLDWLQNEGYGVRTHRWDSGERGNPKLLDHLGQSGIPYKFYLMPVWNKVNFTEDFEGNFSDHDDDIVKFFELFERDFDDLDIYGRDITSKYEIKINGEKIEIYNFLDFHEENKEELDSFKIELSIVEEDGNDDMIDECPHWGGKVPLRFNTQPSEGSTEYNTICEYGLIRIKSEIGKLIKAHGYTSYSNLARNGYMDRLLERETDTLIKYMNLSNVHVTRNEEIKIASTVSENLRKGSKLFDENHSDRLHRIDVNLVSRFLKESPNISPLS
jgi:hypothetical protein